MGCGNTCTEYATSRVIIKGIRYETSLCFDSATLPTSVILFKQFIFIKIVIIIIIIIIFFGLFSLCLFVLSIVLCQVLNKAVDSRP